MRFRPTFILLLLFSSPLLADEGWTLLTADFRHQSVTLVQLDDTGARVLIGGGEPTLVPLANVLELDHAAAAPNPAPPRGKYNLFLLGGDRLSGDLVGMQDEILSWRSPALGEVKIPIRQLRAISTLESPPDLDEDRKEDQVLLGNRDTVHGIVTGIADGKLNVQSAGDAVPVPLEAMTTVYFASTGAPTKPDARSFRVRFTDDSSLTAPSVGVEGDSLSLKLADGSERKLPLSAVRGIEQLNGPVSWLSTHVPVSNEQVWFSEATFPARMDVPMDAGGRTWQRGIAAHADSRITYALDGSWKVFRTRYAIDSARNARSGVIANVTVRVLLDDQPAYVEKSVRAGKISPVMEIDLGSAKSLTLEVMHNDPTGSQAWLDWLEPALLRDKPAPEPVAPPVVLTTAPSTAPATSPSTKAAVLSP